MKAFVIDRDEPVGGRQLADVADPAPHRCPFSLGGTLAAITEPEARP